MFITFEGPEGSGKSTQAQLLSAYLTQRGWPVLLTREPGGTALGDYLRRLLMNATEVAINSRAEVLLFSAARAQLVAEIIRPALAAGRVVICDRFADSTIAYQSFGRGLALAEVRRVVEFASDGLRPDLTVLLDLPPEEGRRRKGAELGDRFEDEAPEFHRRVRQGYLALAAAEPARWLVVDGRLGRDEIAALVRARVDSLLGAAGGPMGRQPGA